MSPAETRTGNRGGKDFLYLQLRELPYFRGLLRAVESRFYQDYPLAQPVYDVGCGDGHFASLTFDRPIDAGLDPWHAPIHEAKGRGAYRILVEADAARAPFPDAYFASAFSNSVLEHIPHVQAVLDETARVLKPGALFLFSVPNDNFTRNLSVARFLDRIGMKRTANGYRRAFNRISRHAHCDPAAAWVDRLKAAGFEIQTHWSYFSAGALGALEWGHYLGLPAAVSKKLFGRWILAPWPANLWLTTSLVRRYYNEPVPDELGAYTFYVARRVPSAKTRQPADA
ncbi:MAG: class I SAM-dependent methyltransferase [Anaerolineales bacterium]